jgi:hypothetical protein
MARADEWYPSDAEGQAQFQENLNAQLASFAVKYGVSAATIDRVKDNAEWIRFWVNYRYEFEQQSEQLTKYYNALALGKDAGGAITAPVITLPGTLPDEVEPDVKSFTYALRREIVNKSNYSIADGALLGFEAPAGVSKPDSEITAEFTNKTLADFDLAIRFAKQDLDGIRLEVRRKGGAWQFLDKLTADGSVHVSPTEPGEAEQIELRGVMLRKNQPVGNYSEIQTALITP